MFCGAVALITCASSSVDGDILLEMREEFAQMKAEISELKVKLNATTAGELKIFVVSASAMDRTILHRFRRRLRPGRRARRVVVCDSTDEDRHGDGNGRRHMYQIELNS